MSQADTNGNNIGFNFTGTGAVPQTVNIVTTAADPTDAVHFGLTALPNAAAEAAGGLYTRGTGAGQIAQDANGNVRVNVDTIKTNPVVNGGTITFPTTATLASTTNITAASGVALAAGQKVDVDTIKTQAVAVSGAGTVTFPNATVASTANITGGTITTVTNLTNAPTNGDLTATMKTSVTTACTASTPTATLANGAHGGAAATLTLGGAGGLTATHTGNTTGSVGSVVGLTASDVGAIKTKTDFLPSAAAGAAGGLFIAGTNAPVTITGTGNALTLTSTGGNGSGLAATGNGSGDGAHFQGGSLPGGDGIHTEGGANGTCRGIHAIGGATAGAGIRSEAPSASGDGLMLVGGIAGKALNAATTNMVLAKTTNITGFNDIAATDVVSGGAITTNAGKVSGVALVDTTTSVTNDVGITQAGADKVWGSAARTLTGFGSLVADTAAAVWGSVIRTLTTAIPSATDNADALLNRDMGAVTVTNSRSPINALRILRNKWSLGGGTLTVCGEDDTAVAWTAAVTTAPGADPISEVDPA